MRRFVCVDFDHTVSSKHVYNIILEYMCKTLKAQDTKLPKSESLDHYNQILIDWVTAHEADIWPLVREVRPIGSPEQWQAIFTSLKEHGDSIAIVSFSPFQNILKRYLSEVVGLSQEMIDSIIFVTYLPENSNTTDKNYHIVYALEIYYQQGGEVNFEADDIWLIDDSLRNIHGAKEAGFKTISAHDCLHIMRIVGQLGCPHVPSIIIPKVNAATSSSCTTTSSSAMPKQSLLRQTYRHGLSFSCGNIKTSMSTAQEEELSLLSTPKMSHRLPFETSSTASLDVASVPSHATTGSEQTAVTQKPLLTKPAHRKTLSDASFFSFRCSQHKGKENTLIQLQQRSMLCRSYG